LVIDNNERLIDKKYLANLNFEDDPEKKILLH